MASGEYTKLMEAAMAVLQATPTLSLNITVLNKALFYLDLYALRDLGDVITGHDFVALPQGPVLQSYPSTLVRPLTEAGIAEQYDRGKAKPIRVIQNIKPELLSEAELELATWMGRSFSPLTSMAVSDLSHLNPGWIRAFRDYVEGRPGHKINMLIALQQLHDPDEDDSEWMNTPADNETLEIANRAGRATKLWE